MRKTSSTGRLIALLAVAGCGAEPAVERGRELFTSASFSTAAANVFACSTCHSVLATGEPTKKLAGYTLYDSVARPSWWGGRFSALRDAVNECYVGYMNGAPLDAAATDGRALLVYLESISPDPQAPALPLTTVDTLDVAYYAKLMGGDATRGEALYANTCAGCHGALHTGSGRLGPNCTILPDETIARHGTDPMTGAFAVSVEKVRHGRFFSVGGNMPEYSLEALSDADLADILAWEFH
jgi:thiosulfate dehydrogenase